MGNLLRNVVIGLAVNYAVSKLSQAAGGVAANIDWTLEKINRRDLSVTLRRGKVVGLVTVKLRILNKNSVFIYLKGYQANIYQDGMLLGSIDTLSNIELPSNELRTLTAEFEVVGEKFIERLEQLLAGKDSVLDPIQIDGKVSLSEGVVLPLSQQIEFFALS